MTNGLLVGPATRAAIFDLWLFFAGEAGLPGACPCFSDTLLAQAATAALTCLRTTTFNM
jgi:hypothetical protein